MKNSLGIWLGLGLLACGCASSGPRLKDMAAPVPFQKPGKSPQAAKAALLYDHFRVFVNSEGVQAGHHYFEIDALPAYVDASGWPDLKEKMAKPVADFDHYSHVEGFKEMLKWLPGGSFILNSMDDYDSQRRQMAINGVGEVATEFNGRLAALLGLGISDAGFRKPPPKPLAELQVQLGDNASLADWVDDYQLWKFNDGWLLGRKRLDQADLPDALERIGAPEAGAFRHTLWWSKQAYRTVCLGAIAAAVGAGLMAGDKGGNPTGQAFLYAGLGVLSVGICFEVGSQAFLASNQAAYNNSLAGHLQQRALQ